MKTKTKKPSKPFHLHVEHFFRHQYCLLAVLGLLGVAIVRSDSELTRAMRDAYMHGYGMLGAYMREETARMPITLETARIATISGQ